jgi:hypothetical protein
MDPDPDPTPTPDLTPFSSVTLGCKKIKFFHIFSYNLPAGTLFSVLKISFLSKILYLNFILQALFQFARHHYEKREGSRALTLT